MNCICDSLLYSDICAICRPILPVFEITQVDGYRSIFNIYSSSVYPPRHFSAVSSSVTSPLLLCRFSLFLFLLISSRRSSPRFRHEISILVSSRFHQSISLCLSTLTSTYCYCSSPSIDLYLSRGESIISRPMLYQVD